MHTKGPWRAVEVKGGISPFEVVQENNVKNMICENRHGVFPDTVEYDEANSNALLLAAAPELLEACKYIVKYHRDHDSGEGELYGLDFVTTCISAIRKAEGK